MYRPTTLTQAQADLLDSMGLLAWWQADQAVFARDLEGAVWIIANELVGPVTQQLRDVFSGDQTLAGWLASLAA